MRDKYNKKSCLKLRITELNGHQVHVVEGDNPKSLHLLAHAYKTIYELAFPIASEREPISAWENRLKDRFSSCSITISILGDDLDSNDPKPKAMSIGYYYKNYDVGLLGYLVTAPAWQGRGLGHSLNAANNAALLEMAKNMGNPLRGIFLECNDPDKISAEDDVMDPQKRVDMYKKWGAIVLPINYIQPPLEHGAEACDTLVLMAYPHPLTGQYPSYDAIKGYVTGIYKELETYSGVTLENNPHYMTTMCQLDAMAELSNRTTFAGTKKRRIAV